MLSLSYLPAVGLIRPGLETGVKRLRPVFNPGRLGPTVPGQITAGKRIG